MPPLVAAAAISGLAAAGTAVIGSRAQTGATKRATAAQQQAAARAEAFEREQDAREQADHARIEAEDRRRWDVDQQNTAAIRKQEDERLRMMDARQNYEDQIRYQKMVRLAELTGGQTPMAPPRFGLGASGTYAPDPISQTIPGAAIMSRPSTANAMITPPGAFVPPAAPGPFDPFTDAASQPFGIPFSAVNRRKVR